MYKSAIRTAALRIWTEEAAYDLRHLFSGVEIYRPPCKETPLIRKEHQHDLYHIVLYTRGRGIMNYCGEEISFEPGFLALTSPGQSHMFGPHDTCDSIVEYRNFTFDMPDAANRPLQVSFAELLASWWNVPARDINVVPHRLNQAEMKEFLPALDRAIELEIERECFPSPKDVPIVLELLSILLRISMRNNTSARERKIDERLLKARFLLENDLQGRLDVVSLAKAAGMSRAYFIRSFKSAFGKTPIHYSRQLRLFKARKMLEHGVLPGKAIAEANGFCDEFHLSKAFKAEFGESPTAFRRRVEFARI